MKRIGQNAEHRLQSESNIWVATVRPDGRPHLTPVWFVWHDGQVYICIDPNSVKARNIARNDRVALSLEDGASPLIFEGVGRAVGMSDWPPGAIDGFKRKYNWNIATDGQYSLLVEITPHKLLNWNSDG